MIMKKLKASLAVVLAAASILSLSGCAEDVAPVPGNPGGDTIQTQGDATVPATTSATTTFAENEKVNEAVENIDLSVLDNPDLEVKERIEWMSFYVIDETSPAAMLFKDVYGIPEKGKYAECEGKIFDYTHVSWEERYNKLGAAITADQSPDLFAFEILDFPYGVVQGRYNPVSDIIDLEGPKWDGAREMMEQFKFGDDYYCAFYEISFNNLMYYQKSNIEALGVEDPRALFEKGEWTWDTFLDISRKWQQSGEEKYCIDGFNPENDFIISSGVPMVGHNGVELVNNLHDPAVERAEEHMLKVLQKENLRYPRHEKNGFTVNTKLWADDGTLFYADGGTWVFQDQDKLGRYRKKYGWPEDEIICVPFPRDPKADAHYITAKQDAMMWIKGSDNPNGVAAWLDCCVTASQDPGVREAAKEQLKENYGWSDYNLDAIYEWTKLDGTSPLTPIFDFKGGLGTVSDASATENPIQSLTNSVYLLGESYTELRAKHENQINSAIEEINEYMAKM